MPSDKGNHKGHLTEENMPLPTPWLIKNVYGLMTLSAILFSLPCALGLALLLEFVLNQRMGFSFGLPLEVVLALGVATSTCPILYIAHRHRSKYVVDCVESYLALGGYGEAKQIAMSFNHKIDFREWRERPRFRSFVLETQLDGEVPRFARFADKYGS